MNISIIGYAHISVYPELFVYSPYPVEIYVYL